MINISFDNPYLLLLMIPLALAVIIPYCIAIRKENRSKGSTIALISHLIIIVLSVLAIAGMKNVTVMTKTEIYVLADVSNSTSKKFDLMDEYIEELEGKLPKNSEMAVIAFGADYKLHTKLGEDFVTVKESGVDDSATDILSVLNHVETLFSDDTIKRVVLYTDGMSTDPNSNNGLIRAVENLAEKDVYVDVVYIDSNLSDDAVELQVSDVEFNVSTYLGHESNASILVESTVEAGAIVRLTKNGAPYLEKTANLTPGYNIVNFELATDEAGEFDYQVTLYPENDASDRNNSFNFTQKINENISVLLITDNKADVDIVKAIYGENATVDAYVKPDPPKKPVWGPTPKPDPFDVPFMVEDLCKYDEYILSNVAIDEVNNADTLVASLDICVSRFGKSLITAGNNNLSNNERGEASNVLLEFKNTSAGEVDLAFTLTWTDKDARAEDDSETPEQPSAPTAVISGSKLPFKTASYTVNIPAGESAKFRFYSANEEDNYSVKVEFEESVVEVLVDDEKITSGDEFDFDFSENVKYATSIESLNNMLPVNFGNKDSDSKLYTIVIDASRSMEFKNFDFFTMAKNAAKYLLDFLKEGDYFALVYFSGEVYVPMTPVEVSKKTVNEAIEIIDGLEVTQGTMIGRTLDRVREMMAPYLFEDKQVMLISDGMSFEGGEIYADDPIGAATRLRESGVKVSALNAGNLEGVESMQNIAAAGGGKYYFAESSKDLVGVMFDEIADDVTETLIMGTSEIIINRPNDSVLEGVESLPPIEAYVYARSKASAENILFVEYVKSSGATVKAPVYAYWNYGNGKVSTLTTNLGGEWVPNWADGSGKIFLNNITVTNTPKEKIDYPYTVDVAFDGKYTHIEIIPAVLNPDAVMNVSVTMPDGSIITEKLVFDSYRYFYEFETKEVGKYKIDTSYELETKKYPSSSVFNISYSPEYDSFTSFSPAPIHSFMRNNGTVTEEGNVTLTTDESRLDTYVLRFAIPFLLAAAVLYVIDTIVRKLKWADIKSFFKKRKKEAKK